MTAPSTQDASQVADRAKAWINTTAAQLEPAAAKAAQRLSRATTPVADHIRKRPVAYTAGALLLGAGIGQLLSRKARTAVGDTLSRSWDVASNQGNQATDALRELIRR